MYKLTIDGQYQHVYTTIFAACSDAESHRKMGRSCEITSPCGTMAMSATPFPGKIPQSAQHIARTFAATAWTNPRQDISRYFDQYSQEAAQAGWVIRDMRMMRLRSHWERNWQFYLAAVCLFVGMLSIESLFEAALNQWWPK